jgi:exosortase A
MEAKSLTEREGGAPAASQAASPSLMWLQGGFLLLVGAALYADVFSRMVLQWWTDPNFSHGFIVPLFSLFLVWRKSEELLAVAAEPSWFGLLPVLAALTLLIVGVLGAELFLSRLSLVVLLAGLVILMLGWKWFRALAFPLGVLMMMIPIPAIIFNQIAFPLQLLASQLASELLSLCGVPVLRQGNVIELPSMSLEVVQACSGIRSLVSLLTLAVIYGYFLEKRWIGRTLLALSAIPIAVVANAVRIMGTGLLGQYWGADKAEGFFHSFSGWVIFVVSLTLLFLSHSAIQWLGRGFRRNA